MPWAAGVNDVSVGESHSRIAGLVSLYSVKSEFMSRRSCRPEAADWNSAISNFISYNYTFPTVTSSLISLMNPG